MSSPDERTPTAPAYPSPSAPAYPSTSAPAYPSTNPSTNPTSPTQNYQSTTPPPTTAFPPSLKYRGFSTSICSLFRDPQDCCAIACCGFLQWDRTHYLLTNELPPSLFSRMCRHVFTPLLIFLLAGIAATSIQNRKLNEICTTLLVLGLIGYIIADCALTWYQRVHFRQEISYKAQGGVGPRVQSQSDANCAHCLCGCYERDDFLEEDWGGVVGDGSEEERRGDMCTALWQCFSGFCCGSFCGCWCQLCGVCAIAQEAREVKRMVGREEGLIDYVTFEHYSSFFPKIFGLRFSMNDNLVEHYQALSKLSKLLLKSLGLVVLALVFLALFNDRFTLNSVLVFMATFCQAFIVLWAVHWQWNRFDLSLDAVVKYFAAGFLLTTFLAVLFEMIVSIFLQLGMSFIVILSGTNMEVKENEYEGPSEDEADDNAGDDTTSDEDQTTMISEFARTHPGVMVVYLFLNSFALAALVEELCKYFGYRMVEHPDMILDGEVQRTCLEERHHYDVGESDESEVSGGYVGGGENGTVGDAAVLSGNGQVYQNGVVTNNQQGFRRSLNSVGAGITVAMVAVATGFACCENLIYVFVYTKGGVGMELTVLLARSLFPVHPLCAAIQSIGMCRRDLENDKLCKIGWIVLPAIILHGSFDFSLMVFSFLGELKGGEEGDPKMALFSLLCSLVILGLGASYYVMGSKKQIGKLKVMEEAVGDRSRLIF